MLIVSPLLLRPIPSCPLNVTVLLVPAASSIVIVGEVVPATVVVIDSKTGRVLYSTSFVEESQTNTLVLVLPLVTEFNCKESHLTVVVDRERAELFPAPS